MKTLVATFFLILIISCSSGISEEDYNRVKTENDSLRLELDELLFGPDRLLSEANNLISSEEFSSAKIKLTSLIDRHPSSDEAIEGKKLLSIVEDKLNAIKKKIEEEEIAARKAEERRLANATRKMKTRLDDIKGITWYQDRNTKSLAKQMYLYFGKRENKPPFLRLYFQYYAEDWLFVENFVLKTDNDTYTINPTSRVERDNGSGSIWEWYDTEVDSRFLGMVKDVISSKKVTLRFNGQQYYKDITITSSSKTSLQNVLDAYEALGGKLN